MRVSQDDEIEFIRPNKRNVSGSYDSNFTVKSIDTDGQGRAAHIEINGNPSKFLQGHNVFGSDDLLSLVLDCFLKITQALDINYSINEFNKVKTGDYTLSRIDINYSFELSTRVDTRLWIKAAEYKSKRRAGRPTTKKGTIYWGQNSRRWTIKAYSKGDELEAGKKHKLPKELIDTPIKDWADNKLRIELTLRTNELIDYYSNKASYLTKEKIQELFNIYIKRIEMTEQVILTDEKVKNLPTSLKKTYHLWQSGYDLREHSKSTFYRHRKQLLEYGINIDLPCDKTNMTNVVPLIRILEAKPAPIPSWAFERGLVHDSAKCA